MDRPRARGGETDTDLAGEFSVGTGHEGRKLFVARLNEIDLAFAAAECAHDAVDTVARVTVHASHAPFCEAVKKKDPYGSRHEILRPGCSRATGMIRQTCSAPKRSISGPRSSERALRISSRCHFFGAAVHAVHQPCGEISVSP